MAPPVTRPRRSAKRIFLLLLALLLVAGGVWWLFFKPPHYKSPAITAITGGEDLDPFGAPLLKLTEEERPLMGTLFRIVVYAEDEPKAREAIAAAFARGEEINAICSDYDPQSELSRLNTRQNEDPIPVSTTLATVLAHAVASADATSGLFDPTLGTLTQLWRQARDTGQLPDLPSLTAARSATGWQSLHVDQKNNTVRITKPGLKLDLGGIAKGFAADEMLAMLRQKGFPRALIAAGGDIRLGDPPPGARAWRVGIRTFGPEVPEYINVSNCAVSTSGDLHQFVIIEGQRFSHIIDPASGLGLHDRIAATVVAPTATQSDPLATFCCIAPDQALAAFLGGEIACRIVTLNATNPEDRRSPNFPQIELK